MQNQAQNIYTNPSSNSNQINTQAIISRAKEMLMEPKTIWTKIKSEPATVKSLFLGYAIVLAAIPAICGALGMTVIGMMGFKLGLMSALTSQIVGYISGLVGLYVGAFIIQFLAPKFGGNATMTDALKLIMYSMTVTWVAGVLYLIPLLSALVILAGIYALYTFYQGITPMVAVPHEKKLPFFALTIISFIAASFVIGLLTAPFTIGATIGSTINSSNINVPDFTNNQGFDVQKFGEGLKELEKLVPQKGN